MVDVPKFISFYWGGGPLSYLQHLSVVSFKKHNPNWGVNLFMPKATRLVESTWNTNEHINKYVGRDYLDEAKELCNVELIDFEEEFGLEDHVHEVAKKDFLMWYMLYTRAGVWSDIDILYTQPIDKLLEYKFDFTVCYDDSPYIGLFITKEKQKIFDDLHEQAKDIVRRNANDGYQSLGADILRAKFREFEAVKRAYPESNILNLPMDIVYAYKPNSDIYDMFFGDKDNTTENTIGLHWYNGSFMSKEYQNNFEKYRRNASVVSRAIRDLECSL